MDLAQLKAVMQQNGPGWTQLLAEQPRHGTHRRSQICTALSMRGIESPGIDVWDYGFLDHRVVEFPPTA